MRFSHNRLLIKLVGVDPGIVFSARKGCETFSIFETMLDDILKECFPKNNLVAFLQVKT
jgi:hypothetical protein